MDSYLKAGRLQDFFIFFFDFVEPLNKLVGLILPVVEFLRTDYESFLVFLFYTGFKEEVCELCLLPRFEAATV